MTRRDAHCIVFNLIAFLACIAVPAAQDGPLLARKYVDGERVEYVMKTENNGIASQVQIDGVVRKTPDGRFVDECSFSNLIVSGKPRALAESAQALRAQVSLDGKSAPFTPPDLSQAPNLVGPVTDLLTFYADLFLVMHKGNLRRAGDHVYVPNDVIASWADGTFVLIGEGAIDFDISLKAVDGGVATIVVKHVPSRGLKIKIPAEWMRAPVADTPNNHVQVRRTKEGYRASIGKETFDVELRVAVADGRILSASMSNPVTKITRDCIDAALTQCDESRPDPVFRRIEMVLQNQ